MKSKGLLAVLAALGLAGAVQAGWLNLNMTGGVSAIEPVGGWILSGTKVILGTITNFVGIGTASPVYPLQVNANQADYTAVFINASSNSFGLLINNNNSTNTNTVLELRNTAGETFGVDNNGTVGISVKAQATIDGITPRKAGMLIYNSTLGLVCVSTGTGAGAFTRLYSSSGTVCR